MQKAKPMRLETALSQLYVNAFLMKSKRVEKVSNRGKGQQEKPTRWQKRTNPIVKDTEANAQKLDIRC